MTKGQKENSKKDAIYFFVVFPVLIVIMICTYLFLNKISARNDKVCTYLGKIWLSGSLKDPSALKGCYTYEELARLGKL